MKPSHEPTVARRIALRRIAVATFLVLAAIPVPSADTPAMAVAPPTNNLALAEAFPPATLRSILTPRDRWHPFPPRADRAGWEKVPAEARRELITSGETALGKPLPPLPATLYLGYAREGDRGRYEGPYFDRRRRLHRLVLAECAENKGRFGDAITDTLWAIFEESSWCIPAHVGAQRGGSGLPEIGDPVVDLFAAQTGSSVAWTLYLVGDTLDGVSPRIRKRGAAEVDRRVLSAYLARDYGWMGFSARTAADRPNNWNPWINGNVLTAALLIEPDTERRVALVHRVLRSLDRFLQPYPHDGGCDEGPGYWSRAGGSVLDNLDLLHDATGGKLDVFGHPLIREIGRFIHRVHIADDWYVAIGDCPARTGIDRGVVYRYGLRIGDPELQALATHGARLTELVGDAGGLDLGRGLRTLADLPAMVAGAAATPPLVRDAWLGSDDLQMMIARDRAGTTDGLFIASWGAHNAQSHNHNDVGNLILFADGQPVFVDMGAPTYTAKTFSSRRYEIPAMQSAWHNLPTLNGVQQSAGGRFAARDVTHRATDAVAELTMDLAPAWPADAGVKRWRRTVRLERGVEVRLIEDFQLTRVAPGADLSLITPTVPRTATPGRVALPIAPPSGGKGRQVVLLFDPARLQVEVERFEVGDARLAAVWGPHLHRLHITAQKPAAEDRWDLRLQLEDR